jgi:hypothetical protein
MFQLPCKGAWFLNYLDCIHMKMAITHTSLHKEGEGGGGKQAKQSK